MAFARHNHHKTDAVNSDPRFAFVREKFAKYINNKTFGIAAGTHFIPEIKIEKLETGIERYKASIPGLNPVYATALVNAFGFVSKTPLRVANQNFNTSRTEVIFTYTDDFLPK